MERRHIYASRSTPKRCWARYAKPWVSSETAMPNIQLTAPRSAAKRTAMLVFMLVSLGEMLAGVVLLAAPQQTARLLVDVTLDAGGAIVARMLGVAVLALGITWWLARAEPGRCTPGFLVYNFGVGLLFGWAAL